MMMNIRNITNSRIARKLVLTIILFSALITLIITALQLYLEYRKDLQSIEDNFAMIESGYLPSLAQAAWVYDEDQLHVQLEGILGLPGMSYVEIRTNGKTVMSLGSQTANQLINKKYALVHQENGRDIDIGHLYIGNSLTRIYMRLIERAVIILISNTFKTFVVAGFILVVFHLLVTRRLIGLAHQVSTIDLGRDPASLERDDAVPVPKSLDEMDRVIEATQRMRVRIERAYKALQKSENQYRNLISQMSAGFALHEIVRDDHGVLVDYRFIEVNHAFEQLTGIKRDMLVGKTVLEVLPNTEKSRIQTYGQVAISREPIQFEDYSSELEKYFEGIAYAPEQGKFATVFTDVTKRVQLEIELQQSREKLRNLTSHLYEIMEMDRMALSQKIHDDFGQTLSAVKLDIGWVKKRLNPDQEDIRKKLNNIISSLNQSVQTARNLYTELRPPILDDFGFSTTAGWLVDQFQEQTGIHCRLTSEIDDTLLNHDIATNAFRILQGALANIRQHAGATQVKVDITQKSGWLVLKVIDNGRGIKEPEIVGSKSLGIIGMRERVVSLGGDLAITGKPNQGTILKASFPLTREPGYKSSSER
jgi:PAS domain S-box-containing protein